MCIRDRDRVFEAWTTTIMNDTDFLIRNAMERWMNAINALSDNSGLENPSDYMVDAFVDDSKEGRRKQTNNNLVIKMKNMRRHRAIQCIESSSFT